MTQETNVKKKKIKDEMQEILNRMTKLQADTKLREQQLQSLFEYELRKVKQNFELCSNKLRSDFESLKSIEKELKSTVRFAKSEVAHWKAGYESGLQVCQTKIYLIELTQTHRKLLSFLHEQKCQLTDIDKLQDAKPFQVNVEAMIASIEEMSEQISESDRGVCVKCKGEVGSQLTKITDIKSQILSRAKLSISKHLRDAN